MTHRTLATAALLLVTTLAWAWRPWSLPMDSADRALDTLSYHARWTGTIASGRYAPFWFTAGKHGTISVQPGSTLLRGGISKPAVRHARWWDYSYGIDLVGGLDVTPQRTSGDIRPRYQAQTYGNIVELYAHLRLWCFDITAGWLPMDVGNQDPTLSSGGLLVSTNAPSIPRITIGIDRWTPFPLTYGYLEIKGAVTQGWFTDRLGVKHTMLHHKYAGIRLGGSLPVNISYEFHHAAQWGGISDRYGKLGSSLHNWWTIFRAKSGGVMSSDQINAEGNHVGSQMLGLDIKFPDWHIHAYWQNIFEDGPVLPIWHTMNIYDGLWGISIRQTRWQFIQSILYELIHTTDQSGTNHDIDGIVFGGADSYFTNSIYTQGWNHYRLSIGNPLITSPIYNTDPLYLQTLNNRTLTHHIALCGDIYGFRYIARYSHSRNYGTYQTPNRTINNNILLEVNKTIPQAWHLNFGIALGADIGTQFGNTYGIMISIAKRGIIWKSKK